MRIEIPAHYNTWKDGAQFGTVVQQHKTGRFAGWWVRMDDKKIKRLVYVPTGEQKFCRILDGNP